MGDAANPDDINPPYGTSYFIGEAEARTEMPSQLKERLTTKKEPSTNFMEKQRERDKREMNDKKMQKLKEHHEKVDRLSTQKRLKKQTEQALTADAEVTCSENENKNHSSLHSCNAERENG
ncbi:unnamed protein product [Dicrocoelium dendriticum]|nr:unnamed protein product [Dicrocoelium dendriticum]